jgi:flagellar basal-body rod protein FlgF
MAMFRHMDVTANNLANSATTGFQAERAMFTDYITESGKEDVAFTQDIATYHDLRQGSLQSTGNDFDVAIVGDGYFAIATPAGERYTRAGNFATNREGTLVTVDGYPVLDDGGQPIQFEELDRDPVIGENGLITVNGGEERAILGIFEFNNRQELRHVEGTMYEASAPGDIAVASRVVHGALETSNVRAVNELVQLTELSRSTSNTAKYIETMYDLQRKASNTWTKQD